MTVSVWSGNWPGSVPSGHIQSTADHKVLDVYRPLSPKKPGFLLNFMHANTHKVLIFLL